MAKLDPHRMHIAGTYGTVTIYVLRGQFYMRAKSTLSGERVKTDPAFAPLMAYSVLFGRASKMGSVIYHIVCPEGKQRWLYQGITGYAMKLIMNSGMSDEEIQAFLTQEYEWRYARKLKKKGAKRSSCMDSGKVMTCSNVLTGGKAMPVEEIDKDTFKEYVAERKSPKKEDSS